MRPLEHSKFTRHQFQAWWFWWAWDYSPLTCLGIIYTSKLYTQQMTCCNAKICSMLWIQPLPSTSQLCLLFVMKYHGWSLRIKFCGLNFEDEVWGWKFDQILGWEHDRLHDMYIGNLSLYIFCGNVVEEAKIAKVVIGWKFVLFHRSFIQTERKN
jgi:hypothetical protein